MRGESFKRERLIEMSEDSLESALMKATERGWHRKVEDLLLRGAKTNCAMNDGMYFTPLMMASMREDQKTLRHLLKKEDLNLQDHKGRTALYFAAEFESRECMDMLLKAGADPNLCSVSRSSPLMMACSKKSTETIRLLLGAGADPHHKDEDEWTALMIASVSHSLDVVNEMLPVSELWERNDEGETAFDLALTCRNMDFAGLIQAYASKTAMETDEKISRTLKKRGKRVL